MKFRKLLFCASTLFIAFSSLVRGQEYSVTSPSGRINAVVAVGDNVKYSVSYETNPFGSASLGKQAFPSRRYRMKQVVIIGANGRIFLLRCSSGLHRFMQSNCCVYVT